LVGFSNEVKWVAVFGKNRTGVGVGVNVIVGVRDGVSVIGSSVGVGAAQPAAEKRISKTMIRNWAERGVFITCIWELFYLFYVLIIHAIPLTWKGVIKVRGEK
jgi:hypothetical protein